MKPIKRLTALLLALTMVFALAACSEGVGKRNLFDTGEAETVQKTDAKPAETQKATEAPATEKSATTAAIDPNDSFAAIGSPAIDTALVGTWSYMLDYTALMQASSDDMDQLDDMTKSILEAFDGIQMELDLDLRADGSFTFGIDEDSARDAVEIMFPKLGEIMLPLIISMMGMTEEELAATLEEQGMTMEEFTEQVMASMQEQMDPEEMIAGMKESTRSGSWRYADGKLYLIEEGDSVDPDRFTTVELRNGNLTITDVPNGDASEEMYKTMLPMTFTRK